MKHLEEGIIRQVLLGEFALACVTRVSLAEDGVAIARHNIATLQGLPDEVLELVISGGHANGTHDLCEPNQHLLVGKTVEWTSQTIQTTSEGEVGVRQGRSNQVHSVGTDIASLVVTESSKNKLSLRVIKIKTHF